MNIASQLQADVLRYFGPRGLWELNPPMTLQEARHAVALLERHPTLPELGLTTDTDDREAVGAIVRALRDPSHVGKREDYATPAIHASVLAALREDGERA